VSTSIYKSSFISFCHLIITGTRDNTPDEIRRMNLKLLIRAQAGKCPYKGRFYIKIPKGLNSLRVFTPDEIRRMNLKLLTGA